MTPGLPPGARFLASGHEVIPRNPTVRYRPLLFRLHNHHLEPLFRVSQAARMNPSKSSVYSTSTLPIELRLFVQAMLLARFRALFSAGRRSAARIAMIAITIKSSIKVNLFRRMTSLPFPVNGQ